MLRENVNNKLIMKVYFKKILLGFIAGLINGFFATGGGLIVVPALIYILKLEPKKARATSIFCILPMVLVTSVFYSKNYLIDWNLGLKCALGGIIGGVIGARLLNKFSEKYLKIAFTLFIIYAGISMIIR